MKVNNKPEFSPVTNPTDEQLVAMKEEVTRLIKTFSARGVSYMLNLNGFKVKTGAVNVWLHRGRISAMAAHVICKHKDVQEKGFTRESLRPDVPFWYIDHEG